VLGVLNLLPRVLINACRSRRELLLENLVLRHQLEVLKGGKSRSGSCTRWRALS